MQDSDALEAATQALKKMKAKHGDAFTFPFDLVWEYTDSEVPSLMRPHQAKRLMRSGMIELTGALTKAASDKRAGSSTREYRFGQALIGGPQAAKAAKSQNTAGLILALQEQFEAEGYIITPAELANFYLAMAASPLVILSGISGTGKSLLPRKFAAHTKASFHSVCVQPQWTDNTDLFGYTPALAPTSYVEGKFIPALKEAATNPGRLVIALLDEMNLAPVEHYFSDFLSVMESARREAGGQVKTDALPIELPPIIPGKDDPYAALRNLGLPRNLKVVGTANMDETTKVFSPKVLDRAFTIEFDDPDLTAFAADAAGTKGSPLEKLAESLAADLPITIHEARGDSQELFDRASALLEEVRVILKPAGVKLGYRTRDSILLYVQRWKAFGLHEILPDNAALDFCLLQKILPKVVGSGDALLDALETLSKWLSKDRSGEDGADAGFNGPFQRSVDKVDRMKKLLESDGVTQFWGV